MCVCVCVRVWRGLGVVVVCVYVMCVVSCHLDVVRRTRLHCCCCLLSMRCEEESRCFIVLMVARFTAWFTDALL